MIEHLKLNRVNSKKGTEEDRISSQGRILKCTSLVSISISYIRAHVDS